ncbi:MAG: GTP-binding protein, partial [Rectinemataceae bacterium]
MIILGLAGHVDHGKTALVRAITGIDTDRLPEEKARGMTTDLGFAAMELDYEGRHLEIGVVDVPGHERYIRNMVAGAWALDLVLLVVAADDGWMYQTENHARALAALG